MDKTFDHNKHQDQIYTLWEASGAFTPKAGKGKPFTVIMPPPNANDPLHAGHARFVAVEDTLIRYHRMRGEQALWLPGADHAGIETQFVFEKKLKKQGKSRFDFDNKTLYKMIWDHVEASRQTMENQLRALGASCDWTRNKFTLDPEIVKVVYTTFNSLYRDGLVYRGEALVNYCPSCGTGYSQLEIEHEEREGYLYHLDYGSVVVATTRPETIFADVAVAINPKDERVRKLRGKNAVIPLLNREVPIIEDSAVEMEFGTGTLKITPGHDQTDYEIGKRHKLPVISVLDEAGRLTNSPAKYTGLTVTKARELVVADLEAAGKLVKVVPHTNSVAVCYRCKNVIEPSIRKQWFIKVDSLAKQALKSITGKTVKFNAKKYESVAKNWLKNLRDWNISRQIVWGMQIPAWRCEKCLEWTITEGATPKKCSSCSTDKLTRDPDTFDTWFSSGQWPFATLMTTKPGDFNFFYPTNVMNTAYEIIPFWVIRMLMLGLYKTGKVPFTDVVIHGLVRDGKGLKMSKSKGNVIDPLKMIEQYGTDALRMGLLWGGLIENDIALDEEKIRGQRNFANKLWNVSRFVLASGKATDKKPRAKTTDDKWILSELAKTTKRVTKRLDKFILNDATSELYDFVWHRFADKYLESTKDRREEAQPVLNYVLAQSLKLLHPFMPFVTESIWQHGFAQNKSDLLVSKSWPTA